MLRATSCTVTLADETVLTRQKIWVDESGVFTSKNRRTGEVTYTAETTSVERIGRNSWTIVTTSGDTIKVKKAGCNCGG
jgi:hypothetical protein